MQGNVLSMSAYAKDTDTDPDIKHVGSPTSRSLFAAHLCLSQSAVSGSAARARLYAWMPDQSQSAVPDVVHKFGFANGPDKVVTSQVCDGEGPHMKVSRNGDCVCVPVNVRKLMYLEGA